ncbi:MAG: GNAT family N-acetyltransferase [Chloroflexota bacterium]
MVTTALTIRDAIPIDRSDILHINRLAWEACYAHIFTPQEIRGLFRGIYRQQGSWVHQRGDYLKTFIAEIDEVIVGFIGTASLRHTNQAEITTFYLHPDYLRQGIGRQLWQSAMRYLGQDGYDGAWVWTLSRADACHFYLAQGCIESDRGTYRVGSHSEEVIGFWLAL